jgi:RNA polymerase sigma-70 factor (ECF subfamily)
MHGEAFDLALVEMSARLRTFFARKVSDSAIADDLIQETLLKALRARETLRDQTVLEAWVYRIAHHTLADYYRWKSIPTEVCCDVRAEQTQAADNIRAVLACSARCYLGTLPAAYRVPVHLVDYDGLSHREVARKLNLSLSATKSRVRRGKMMVRNLMEAHCKFEYDIFGNVIGYQVRSVPRRIAAIK